MEFVQNTCNHADLIPYNNKFFCKLCGIYMPEEDNLALKSKTMSFPGYLNPMQNLKKQWNHAVPVITLPQEYSKQRSTLVEYMIEWSDKLKLSANSLFLAVQFLDYFVATKKVDSIQYRLYGATCLMLAAKSIELDERIPFISKLRRFTYLPYGTLDFRRCECQVIKQLNWNLQCTTILDWAESALSLGILFEKDELIQENALKEKNQNILLQKTELFKEHLDTVFKSANKPCAAKLQDEVIKLCYAILKDGTFLEKDPGDLTVSLVACARRACGLKSAMPKYLSTLFDNIQPSMIDSLTDQFVKPPTTIKVPFGRAQTTDLDFFSLQNYRNRVV